MAACVLRTWQVQQKHQQEEKQDGQTQQEALNRMGKYVIIFKKPSAPTTGGRNHPALREGYQTIPLEELLQNYEYKEASRAYNQVKRTDSLPVWGGEGEGVKRKSDGGPRRRKKEEEEEDEEEQDPNVARGFLDEYVTYRSDGNSFLLVEDDRRNLKATQMTLSYDTTDAVTKDVSSMQPYFDNTAIYRNSVLRTEESVDGDAGETKNFKFKFYNPGDPFKMTMRDDKKVYFQDIGGVTCFIDGTDITGSQLEGVGGCRCLDGYFGVDCGIPEAAWFDTYRNKYPETRLQRRKVPRRVINGLTVNHEFAMFEARLHELYPVVDAFIVAESNYTAHGDPKEFLFLEKLRQGYMKGFQDKLLYVSLDFFSNSSRSSGWVADAYLRIHLGIKGIPLLKDLRQDDLFVLSDADELPTREVITFLKLYDGYPEPISFALQWNVYGFFWKVSAEATWTNWAKRAEGRVSTVSSVVTIGMLTKLLNNNAFLIRKTGLMQHYEMFKKLKKYRNEGHLVKEWVIGKAGHCAGWHCSWCFR